MLTIYRNKKTSSILILSFILALPGLYGVQADYDDYFSGSDDTTVITNQVQATANTGGNSAAAGEIKIGESKSEVIIKTDIDGQKVEDIHEISTSTGAATISATTTVNASGKQANVKSDIEINGEEFNSDKNIILDNPDSASVNSISAEPAVATGEQGNDSASEKASIAGDASSEEKENIIIALFKHFLNGIKNFFNNFLV